MVRKFKVAIIWVKLFIASLILYIKDAMFRFWFKQTIDDVYYLKTMRAEEVRSADWVKMLEIVNFDLEIARGLSQRSGIKCIEEATKDVMWRYDVFTNKVRVIKVK